MVKLSQTVTFLFTLFLCRAFADDIPTACYDELIAIANCVALLPDAGASCATCWSNSIPQDATACNDFEGRFCPAFTSCDCGSCDPQVIAYVNCVTDDVLGESVCEINCSNTGSGTSAKPLASALLLVILALTY